MKIKVKLGSFEPPRLHLSIVFKDAQCSSACFSQACNGSGQHRSMHGAQDDKAAFSGDQGAPRDCPKGKGQTGGSGPLSPPAPAQEWTGASVGVGGVGRELGRVGTSDGMAWKGNLLRVGRGMRERHWRGDSKF